MKKLLFVMILALLAAGAAQAREKQDVVRLKNGHAIRGKIVVYEPLDSLVIQEEDGTQTTVRWKNIHKITKEKWQPQSSTGGNFTAGLGLQKGYRGFVDAELFISIDANSRTHFGVSTTHGYQVKPYLFVGAGVGARFIHDGPIYNMRDEKTFVAIPVFADVRLDLYKNKISPFVDAKVGYALGDKAFGLMFNPTVGCRFALGNSPIALNVGVGYSYMSTDLMMSMGEPRIHHIDSSHDGSSSWENNPFHCLSFKVGVEF